MGGGRGLIAGRMRIGGSCRPAWRPCVRPRRGVAWAPSDSSTSRRDLCRGARTGFAGRRDLFVRRFQNQFHFAMMIAFYFLPTEPHPPRVDGEEGWSAKAHDTKDAPDPIHLVWMVKKVGWLSRDSLSRTTRFTIQQAGWGLGLFPFLASSPVFFTIHTRWMGPRRDLRRTTRAAKPTNKSTIVPGSGTGQKSPADMSVPAAAGSDPIMTSTADPPVRLVRAGGPALSSVI